jgi:hypothetical protein
MGTHKRKSKRVELLELSRQQELRSVLTPEEYDYKFKSFLTEFNIDPAYMNFYKFLQDPEFELPLQGLLSLIRGAGFDLQLTLVNKNFKYDDAKEWDQFLTHLKNVVFKYHVPKKITDPTDGKPLKKRVSSKTIMTSMNEVDTISTSELQNLMDEVW